MFCERNRLQEIIIDKVIFYIMQIKLCIKNLHCVVLLVFKDMKFGNYGSLSYHSSYAIKSILEIVWFVSKFLFNRWLFVPISFRTQIV